MRIDLTTPILTVLIALAVFSVGCGGGGDDGNGTTGAGVPATGGRVEGTSTDGSAEAGGGEGGDGKSSGAGEGTSTAGNDGGGGSSGPSKGGGGSPGSGNGGGNTEEPAKRREKSSENEARQQFIEEANALCTKATAQFEADLEPYVENGLGSLERNSAAVVDEVLVPSLAAEIDEIRALGPPAADDRRVETILTALSEEVEQAQSDPGGFIATGSSAYAESQRLASEYGIGACGSL